MRASQLRELLLVQPECLPALLASLRANGVEYSIDDVPLVGDVQVFFRDPSGAGVELNFDAATERS
ncbi:MAG: hypothetical protein ACREUG_09610 [Steroidobacteraceae bacterium]